MICIKRQLYQFFSWLLNVGLKKILKMTPPSVQKFDLEDTGKLVAIVAASEMTREYFIKQQILPECINLMSSMAWVKRFYSEKSKKSQ